MPKENIVESFVTASNNIPVPSTTVFEQNFAQAYNDALDEERTRREKLRNDAFQSIIKLRSSLSIIVTIGVFAWMLFVSYTLVSVSHKLWGASLSDTVLLALIGGSTANILGMLTIIVVFLFSKKNNELDYNQF